jgi:succinate dehydrogenase / fumarate reductase, membrane anchor subunit
MSERSMRTPLGRVRHHGASGEGTGHFIGQRVSAIALIVLTTWFVLTAALTMKGPTYVAAIDLVSDPINAVGLALLICVALYHMRLGLQVVIEDYIQKPATKMILLLLNALVPLAIGAGALFALLAVNFGV